MDVAQPRTIDQRIDEVDQHPARYLGLLLEEPTSRGERYLTVLAILEDYARARAEVLNLRAEIKQLRPPPSYSEYLKTPEWLEKAASAKILAGHRCQVCNTPEAIGHLDAHHRTYERLGEELLEDLIVLCRGCHEIFHRARRLHRDD